MTSFFQTLSPQYRQLFTELMAMRDSAGVLSKTADEVATDLIKRFVTKEGKLDPRIADRLGGQPPYGRADVLLDLIRAVTGPHPMPQAWLDAVRLSGFGYFEPEFYDARGTNKSDRSIGSPGVFLQRMVAQYRDWANSRRPMPPQNAALYTEAAMLTTVMVLRELQAATRAKMALGPAWVVGVAVDPLKPKVKRQMDALAGNQQYLRALGLAIAQVTEDYAEPHLKERTTDDVEHSLPPGADIDVFFVGHEEKQLAMTADALVAAVERRAEAVDERRVSPGVDEAIDRLIHAVRRLPLDAEAMAAAVSAATGYLDEPSSWSEAELAEHHDRLSFLMPDLTSNRPLIERAAKLIQTVNTFLDWEVETSPRIFGEPKIDAIYKAIAERINNYVLKVGPPPPSTPLEHLTLFEAGANAAVTSAIGNWPARKQWLSADLIIDQKQTSRDLLFLTEDVRQEGYDKLDVADARRMLSSK